MAKVSQTLLGLQCSMEEVNASLCQNSCLVVVRKAAKYTVTLLPSSCAGGGVDRCSASAPGAAGQCHLGRLGHLGLAEKLGSAACVWDLSKL